MVYMGDCKIFLDIQDRYSFIDNKLQVRLESICHIKQIWMSVLWHNLTKGGAKIFDKFEGGRSTFNEGHDNFTTIKHFNHPPLA